MFRHNVGGLDRKLRLLLGAVLLPVGIYMLAAHGPYGPLVTIVGGLTLLSGLLGYCPLYIPFGISTCQSGCGIPLPQFWSRRADKRGDANLSCCGAADPRQRLKSEEKIR